MHSVNPLSGVTCQGESGVIRKPSYKLQNKQFLNQPNVKFCSVKKVIVWGKILKMGEIIKTLYKLC